MIKCECACVWVWVGVCMCLCRFKIAISIIKFLLWIRRICIICWVHHFMSQRRGMRYHQKKKNMRYAGRKIFFQRRFIYILKRKQLKTDEEHTISIWLLLVQIQFWKTHCFISSLTSYLVKAFVHTKMSRFFFYFTLSNWSIISYFLER